MNQYHAQLAKFKAEAESSYNDGWTQRHYQKEYDELIKMGERKFEQHQIKQKIADIESEITKLNKELNIFKKLLKSL